METIKNLNLFYDSLCEGILLLNSRRDIVYRNRAAEKILGTRIDLKHRINIENVLVPANHDLYELIYNTFLTCRDIKNEEVDIKRNGRAGRVQITTRAYSNEVQEDCFHMLVIVTDITHLWRLHSRERKLLSRFRKNYIDQMENLRQIAQNVAHEVRNPLVSIGGYASHLLNKHEALSDKKALRKYLRYIKQDAERLNTLVNQVERYSNFKDIKFRKKNIIPLIRDVLKYGSRFAKARDISINFPEPEIDEYHIYIDTRRIRLALRYLVKNALLLTARGRPVAINTELTPFDITFSIQFFTYIQKEEVPFLFNPFYSARKQKINFELATAQRIAIMHGGIINPLWNRDQSLSLALNLPREKRHPNH